jgi:hypothetical protein
MRPSSIVTAFNLCSSGKHRLDISKAELLENGAPVSSDRQDGRTGWHDSGNRYRLSLDVLHQDSKYSLRATVRTDGGADSTGEVILKVVLSDYHHEVNDVPVGVRLR